MRWLLQGLTQFTVVSHSMFLAYTRQLKSSQSDNDWQERRRQYEREFWQQQSAHNAGGKRNPSDDVNGGAGVQYRARLSKDVEDEFQKRSSSNPVKKSDLEKIETFTGAKDDKSWY